MNLSRSPTWIVTWHRNIMAWVSDPILLDSSFMYNISSLSISCLEICQLQGRLIDISKSPSFELPMNLWPLT